MSDPPDFDTDKNLTGRPQRLPDIDENEASSLEKLDDSVLEGSDQDQPVSENKIQPTDSTPPAAQDNKPPDIAEESSTRPSKVNLPSELPGPVLPSQIDAPAISDDNSASVPTRALPEIDEFGMPILGRTEKITRPPVDNTFIQSDRPASINQSQKIPPQATIDLSGHYPSHKKVAHFKSRRKS